MTYEIEALKQVMKKLQFENKQALQNLSLMPEGRLYQEKRGERFFYYQRIGMGEKKIRKGITKNHKLLYQLARKEYLLVLTKSHQRSIEIIKRWESIISEPDICFWQQAAEDISKKFSKLTQEIFLLGDQYEPYPNNRANMYLDDIIHRTQKGVKVRSKSELIIADMLESIGIPYQYEAELSFEMHRYYPDFTMIRPRDGKVIYWEHFGLTHDGEYLKKMDHKLEKYRNMGIKPWDNLMISYDEEGGSLDIGIIRALVEGWLT